MCERVKLSDAARELGCSPQAVREHMKRRIWDLGEVVSPKQSGKKQWEYHIYRSKLNKHLGKTERTEEETDADNLRRAGVDSTV